MKTLAKMLFALIGCFSVSLLFAKERVEVSATYDVTASFPNGEIRKWSETWEVKGVVDIEEDPEYTKTTHVKEPQQKATIKTSEKEFALGRKVTRRDSFTLYSWGKHPNFLEDGESTFGHAEEYDRMRLIARYPIFLHAKHITNNLTVVVLKGFLPSGEVLTIEETFSRNGYHLPIEKVITLNSPSLAPLSKVVYLKTK